MKRRSCRRTQSVGDPRLHAVRKNVRDPVFVLRLGQDHNPDVPQSVRRHLEAKELDNSTIIFFHCKVNVSYNKKKIYKTTTKKESSEA